MKKYEEPTISISIFLQQSVITMSGDSNEGKAKSEIGTNNYQSIGYKALF